MICCDLENRDQVLLILKTLLYNNAWLTMGTQSVCADQQTDPRN